jgi:hypothetical protein
MPSTYSSNLKLELMATGENSGTWGNITNTNLGTAVEQAIVGYGNPNYASDANLTISITNSNAAQAARALVLNVTSSLSLTGTRELVVPTIEKQYIVQNNTTGSQSITVKTSAGTGITVPNGRKAHLYVDGTNVIQMFDFVDINGGTIDGTAIGGSSAAAGSFTTLGASGAATFNGAVTLGDAAADNITFNGTITSHLLFTDNTYDIGASGATRPRNLFLAGNATVGGNLSVGGTLTLTGGVNLNGNVTVGDSSADTLTINATITSNLLFTDNTYDIGASGATRPRNLFLAGNATIGGNTTMTGTLTVDSTTDSSSTTTGSIQTDGGLGVAKALYVGTTANIAGAVTLSGGTANGVAYLNGSKVLTTGSALTFDGTNLATTGTASATKLIPTGGTATGNGMYLPSANTLGFSTNGVLNMSLDSSGNLGLGVTPSAWYPAVYTVMDVGAASSFGGFASGASGDELSFMATNTFFNSSNNPIYKANGLASNYRQFNGVHQWFNAPSGTAGNAITFTQAMTLDASGNLGIGITIPTVKLDVQAANVAATGDATPLRLYQDGDGGVAMLFTNNVSNLVRLAGTVTSGGAGTNDGVFTIQTASEGTLAERMRLDSSGNLGIGTSSPSSGSNPGKLAVQSTQDFGISIYRSATSPSQIAFLDNNNSCAIGTDGNSNMVFLNNSRTTERMRLDSSGNLGIGTSSPAYKLDVSGSAFASNWYGPQTAFTVGTVGGGVGLIGYGSTGVGGLTNTLLFQANGEKMRLDSSGNLGLGVTPSAWRSVFRASQIGLGGAVAARTDNSAINLSSNWYEDSGGTDRYINTAAATRYLQFSGAHSWYTAASGTAGNAITFTQAMTLNASGRLQLGATVPGTFDMAILSGTDATANDLTLYGPSTAQIRLQFSRSGGTGRGEVGYDMANDVMRFVTSGSERARITSGGKMLVGTTSTSGTLTVDGVDAVSTGSANTYAITCGNDAADALAFGSDASFAFMQSFGSRALVINFQGNEVRVAGSTDQGAYNLQVNGTGVWGAGAYVNGSDERLKEDIATIDAALDVVTSLRPVTFRYKEAYSKDQSIQPGFIAQELQAAMAGKSYLGGIVQEGPQHLNVAYQSLIPLLTKAIQEQQALIQTLTARVAQLEGK